MRKRQNHFCGVYVHFFFFFFFVFLPKSVSRSHGYAGAVDAICKLGDKLVVVMHLQNRNCFVLFVYFVFL